MASVKALHPSTLHLKQCSCSLKTFHLAGDESSIYVYTSCGRRLVGSDAVEGQGAVIASVEALAPFHFAAETV